MMSKPWFARSLALAVLAVSACGGKPDLKTVADGVEIVTLAANPPTVAAGGRVEISWKTQNAEHVALAANGAPVDLAGAQAADGKVSVVVDAETVFALAATGKTPSDVKTRSVTVQLAGAGDPRIVSFAADPALVDEGQKTTLTWRTEGAETIRILDGALNVVDLGGAAAPEGSVQVAVPASTTFRLVAESGTKKAEATASVRVKGTPVATLTVTPARIVHGGSSTLSWEAQDAASIEIVDDEGQTVVDSSTQLTGTFVVSPSFTTSYRLTAVNGSKQSVASAVVEVEPKITSFLVDDSSPAGIGAPKSLSWEVGGAREVEVSNLSGVTQTFIGMAAARGTATLPMGSDGRFELVARSGSLEARKEVSAAILLEPRIGSFAAERSTLTIGADGLATAVLSWSGVERASRLHLVGETVGEIAVDGSAGSVEVALEADESFTLTASNDSGEVSASATVRLVPAAAIGSFTAQPGRVGAGESFAVSWTTTAATSIELRQNGVLVTTDDGSLSSGTAHLVAAVDSTIELRAFNDAGDFATRTLSVSVGAPMNGAFSATPARLWVGGTATLAWRNLGGTSLSVKRGGVEIFSTADLARIAEGSHTVIVDTAGSTTFTLEVRNGASQTTTTSATVDAGTGPRIASFSVGPAQLLAGTNVNISWQASDDPNGVAPVLSLVDNRGGTYTIPAGSSRAGSLQAPLSQVGDYTFTLTASTPSAGSTPVSQSKTVTVVGMPAATLVATPTVFDQEVAPSVTLSWTSSNAASLVLYQLDAAGAPITPPLQTVPAANRASGSMPVVPTRATTYRIVATNALGNSVSPEATVTLAPTQILTFTATAPTYPAPPAPPTVAVVAGDPATLAWTTKRATRVELDVASGLLLNPSTKPYVDITTLGSTPLPVSVVPGFATAADEGYADLAFPAGFSFPFGGVDRASIRVFTNGVASFDLSPLASSTNTYTSSALGPDSAKTWVHLAPFWDDLVIADAATGIQWLGGSDAASGLRYLIVQWKDAFFFSTSGVSLNFQMVLFEDGTHEYRYGAMNGGSSNQTRANGSQAAIGTRVSGTVFKMLNDTARVEVPGGMANRSLALSYPPSLDVNGSFSWVPMGGSGVVTRTATLTARGNSTATSTVTVAVHPRATVAATPPAREVLRGESFTLAWTSTNATALVVRDQSGAARCTAIGAQIASGSCVLSEATAGRHAYTIRATGALGHTVDRVVDVPVYLPFGIETFAVSAPSIDYGGSVTLNWETGGSSSMTLTANGVSIDLTGKSPAADSLVHAPQKTTTYVLTIEASDGRTRQESRTVTVRTVDLGVVASADNVIPGTPVTLTWTGTSLVPGADVTILAPTPMVPVTSAFVDISADPTATRIIAPNPNTDDLWGSVDLRTAAPGFVFPYFGERYEKLRVGIKGVISFDSTLTGGYFYNNFTMPKADVGSNLYSRVALAPYWGDSRTRAVGTDTGVVTKFVSGGSGPDHFIVQFHHLKMDGTGNDTVDVSFQVVLFADGSFEYRYGAMGPVSNASAQGGAKTIGYQMPGALMGYTVFYGGPFTSSPAAALAFPGGISNKAFRWEPVDPGTTSIVVQPSATTDYTICAIVDGHRECRTVTVHADFVIDSFATSSATINRGQTVDLTWATKGAEALSLKANGVEIANGSTVAMTAGSLTVAPTTTTTYVLELRNNFLNRTITSTKTVTVKQFSVGLQASASNVVPGGPVTLSWTAGMFSGDSMALTTPMAEVTSPFVDISGQPGATQIIGAGADTTMADLPFVGGFTFNYLGTPYSGVRVSTDGFLTFDGSATTSSSNSTLPSSSNKKVHLAAFWKDLHTRTNGRVHALATPTEVIVQWSRISMYTGSSAAEHDLNFQIALRSDGSFEYRYGTMAGLSGTNTSSSCYPSTCANEANASSATIGYQDPTGVAGYLLYMGGTSNSASNFPFAGGLSNRSFRFTPSAGSGSVVVNPGDTTGYRICAISGTFIECSDLVTVTSEWKIVSFDSNATQVDVGQPVTLSWVTTGGDGVRVTATAGTTTTPLDVSSAGVSSGSVTAYPTQTTTYTFELRSMGRGKTTTKSVTVRTVGVTLDASTTTALPGEPVTLTWDVSGLDGGTPTMSSNIVALSEVTTAYEDVTTFGGTLVTGLGLGASTTNGPNATVAFPAGFAFPYFGQNYDRIRVGNQGVLSFDTSLDGYRFSNFQFPSTDSNGIKVHLAPFWGDVQTAASGSASHPDGGVYTKFVQVPGGVDYFIIQYHHHRIYSAADGTTDLNFQVVLFKDGTVEYRYADMLPLTGNNPVLGGAKTVGIQRPGGGWGLNLHYGGAYTSTPTASTTYPGGFAHRSFRFEPLTSSTGSRTVIMNQTTTYYVCGGQSGYSECKEVTIVVPSAGASAITELMLDPDGGPGGQWFKVRNLDSRPQNLEGWELVSNAGSFTIGSPLVIPAGGFATFAASSAVGFTPSAIYGNSLALSPAGDSLALKAGTRVIASVTWGSSWTIPHGTTLVLDPSYQKRGTVSNDAANRWCAGTAEGSPGSLGRGCRFTTYDVDLASAAPVIDISTIGAPVPGITGYLTKGDVSLSFPFPFFGGSSSTLGVSSNGFVTMAGGLAASYFTNASLPSTSLPASLGIVAGFWTDLNFVTGQSWAKYAEVTRGTNRVAVFHWYRWKPNSSSTGAYVSVQIQLWDNGDIVTHQVESSGDTTYTKGSSATIGIQAPGTSSPATLLYSYNTASVEAGTVIHYLKK
ncbi:lamin tail domain-containing protein [Vulgatibacter incomptus]|uniref:lamin tail domain-containing protein n=1 Tax=Vulgatibacter incomptus TaxID=1391653 RepID=UPI000B15DCD9|nr:lamin tail domain-containing protein [Vulgatibacter incomptus]